MKFLTKHSAEAAQWILHGLLFLGLTVMAYYLRTRFLGDMLHLGRVFSLGSLTPWLVLTALVSTFTFRVVGPYRSVTPWTATRAILARTLGSLVVVFVVAAAVTSLVAKHELPRTVVLLMTVLAIPVFIVERIVALRIIGSLRARGVGATKYVLVGAGPAAQEVADAVEEHPERGIRVVGYIDDGAPKAAFTSRYRRICGIDRLNAAVEEATARGFILAASPESKVRIEALYAACQRRRLELVVAVDHDMRLLMRGRGELLADTPVIVLPTGRFGSGWQRHT